MQMGKLVIDMFSDGQCPTSYVTRQIVKKAAKDFSSFIVVRDHDLKDPEVTKKYGLMEGIFIDGESAFFGYPRRDYAEMTDKVREALREKLEAKGTA